MKKFAKRFLMLALSVVMSVSLFVGISVSATAEGATDNVNAVTELAEVKLEASKLLNMLDGNKQFKKNNVILHIIIEKF